MRSYLVLFLGRANTGRTLMAEALVARWGAPRFRAASAGLEPGTEIDSGAALALRADLFATAQPPRLLSDLLVTLEGEIDLVIALDSIEEELGIPGNPPVFRWHVDDPRLNCGGEKDRVRAWRGVLRDLEARIKLLVSLLSRRRDKFLLRPRAQDVARGPGWSAPTRI